jgi:hypothetical protein
MPTREAENINPMTPITIYPNNNSEPIGVYNGYSLLCDNGIIFTTRNTPKKYANIQQVDEFLPVVHFYIGSWQPKKLAVATPVLHKDKKGDYVWKAVNTKVMQPGKGMKTIFKIEKVYVVLGKLKRLYNGITDMQILKDPGTLELYDVIVSAPKVDLKDGQTVCLPPSRYIFMPGDKVKVIIETSSIDNSPILPIEKTTKPNVSKLNSAVDIRNRKIGHHTR